MPRFCLLLFLFAGLIPGPSAPAQSAPATTVTLGQSLVPLNGPWKFHIGDNPQWAGPNFDDSAWETVDLTTKEGSFDPEQGTKGFVPGWTAKGHPGYSGYAWYRMRIRITGANGPLALRAPVNVDDSYQVFANGRLIGSFGNFSGPVPTVNTTRPLMFTLPASALRNGQDGTLELAFRFFMAPRTLLQVNGPGGMHDPPLIGLAAAVTAAWHVAWETNLKAFFPALASALIFLVFSLLILMLYAFDRAEKIVLWPLAACALSGLFLSLVIYSVVSVALTQLPFSILRSVLVPTMVGLWLVTWLTYFELSGKKWLRYLIVLLVLWTIASDLFFQILTLNGPRTPHFVFRVSAVSRSAADAAIVILSALIAYFGIRRARRVDWMLLLALVFFAIPDLNPAFHLLHIPTVFFPFGMNISLALLADIASLFCFSFVLMRRFRASQRRQQAMIHDVKQAQEVQQVLIPEKLPHVAGLDIESEYRPASEVGGDFFQIIPHASDGSALIVAGDVAGKGLQAGMLVALIVGTIRTAIEKSFEPLDVLHALNRRLCERGNAHATCLALRISADGAVTLANAGHLPPYLNGKELPMQGAVPLGMDLGADFASMRFQLAPNDRLMLLSDGVAEAQDEQGRLFGFDRIQTLLAGPVSAAEIASAAQKFGQHDDISIVSITRTAVLEEALA
ncbi:MAG TPA: SpoIIE family protein phosphatase [Acidobacteriaceae bacterium]|nr:SpoIIE family protein phosphatase [Acidobacteriaceae bacterium]